MPSSASAAFRSKYGKYLPHQRFNVDQVPLPFINGMDETYEEVGAKRVAVNQNGPALSKRQETGQVCFGMFLRACVWPKFLISILRSHGQNFLTSGFLNGRL